MSRAKERRHESEGETATATATAAVADGKTRLQRGPTGDDAGPGVGRDGGGNNYGEVRDAGSYAKLTASRDAIDATARTKVVRRPQGREKQGRGWGGRRDCSSRSHRSWTEGRRRRECGGRHWDPGR